MSSKDKENIVFNDEINLYDYWKAIERGKVLIFGLFLVSIAVAIIVSLLSPREYRGEIVIKVPKETITVQELANYIERRREYLIKNHSITNLMASDLKGSPDKLWLIIDSSNNLYIEKFIADLLSLLNSLPEIKQLAGERRERLALRLQEISKTIKESEIGSKTLERLVMGGGLVTIGFSPLDIEKEITNLKVERLALEQDLKRPSRIEVVEELRTTESQRGANLMKNILKAGVIGLIAGLFIAFVVNAKRTAKQ